MSINIGDLLGSLTGGGGNDDNQSGGGGGGGNMLASMLPAIMGMLSGGGLSKIMGGLQAKGLTSEVDSWTSQGPNQQVSPAQIKDVLDDDELAQVADKAHVSKDEAADAISQVLPNLVDKMSPNGQMPGGDALSGLLGSLTKQLGGSAAASGG
jgi:uncharacterized protein YidB (DUF937 family)